MSKKKAQRRKALYFPVFFFILLISFTQADAGGAQEETLSALVDPISGDGISRIIVGISSNARMSNVVNRVDEKGFNIVETEKLYELGAFIIEAPSGSVEDEIARLQNISGVRYAEPDYTAQATDIFPNDPGFATQYALTAIRAPQGWNISTGSNLITIAIIDSGVDYGHADLAGKIDEGHNFIACPDAGLPCSTLPQDDYGHGTHVAGIAAASSNNGVGIAGVSWGARIMPVKVLNRSGGGSYSNVSAGIVWAADHGAQVINLSLGGCSDSTLLHDAILNAYNQGVLIIASAGNFTCGSQVLYPARYPEVMAVGASDALNQPATYWSYGPEVDIAAPGVGIYSSCLGGGYCTLSGTSMSAPHVSGLASILFGYVNNAGTVRGIIESTALDIGDAGWDMYSGVGLIQMDAALAQIIPTTPTLTPTLTLTLTLTLTPTPTRTSTPTLTPTHTPTLTATSTRRPRRIYPRPGYFPLPVLTPTTTSAPLFSPNTITPTQTLSPLEESPTPTSSATPTPTQMPVQTSETEKSGIFPSPYFCGSITLIFLGILFFLWGNNKRSNIKIPKL
jgi:thermitase